MIRAWRNLLIWELVFMASFPVAALAAVGVMVLPGWSYQYHVVFCVLAVVGGVAVAALARVVLFRCPRCGRTYSVRLGPGRFPDRKASSRHCLHCWLPKWADPHREYHDPWDDSDDW